MTERNTRIRPSQISAILPNDLEATNSPSDQQVPVYDSATGKFTWSTQSTGGESTSSSYRQTFINSDLSANKITITHNLNVQNPDVIVYDGDNYQILPTQVKYVSVNSIELDFTGLTPLTGTYSVRITGGAFVNPGRYVKEFTNSDLNAQKLSVVHSLNEKYCIVQVYDNNDKKIEPDEITLQSTTTLEIDLTNFGTITGTWRVIVLR